MARECPCSIPHDARIREKSCGSNSSHTRRRRDLHAPLHARICSDYKTLIVQLGFICAGTRFRDPIARSLLEKAPIALRHQAVKEKSCRTRGWCAAHVRPYSIVFKQRANPLCQGNGFARRREMAGASLGDNFGYAADTSRYHGYSGRTRFQEKHRQPFRER